MAKHMPSSRPEPERDNRQDAGAKGGVRPGKVRTLLQLAAFVLIPPALYLALRVVDVPSPIAMLATLVAFGCLFKWNLSGQASPFAAGLREILDALEVREPPREDARLYEWVALAILLPFVFAPLEKTGFVDLPAWWYAAMLAAAVVGARALWFLLYPEFGHEPLFWRAVMNRNLRSVRRLLAAGANVEELDPNGNPPLVWAVYRGDLKLLRLLLAAGANPDVSVYAHRRGRLVRVALRDLAEQQIKLTGLWARQRRREVAEELAAASLQRAEVRRGRAA